YEVIAKVFVEVEKDIYTAQIYRDNQIHQTLFMISIIVKIMLSIDLFSFTFFIFYLP
ncbi:hypothetical protein Q604_UNBC12396G0001, partial [human gut metagenome]